MEANDDTVDNLENGDTRGPVPHDQEQAMNIPQLPQPLRRSIVYSKSRLHDLAKRNRDLVAQVQTQRDRLRQFELDRQDLMSRFQEANQRAEHAEERASRLKESLVASQEYVESLANRGELGVPGSGREADVLRGRLREIESRLSYRVLRRIQTEITKAIPPNSARAKAWFALRQITGRLDYAKATLASLRQPEAEVETDYHHWMLHHRATPVEIQQQKTVNFAFRPLISFIVPVYNPPPRVLRDTIEAVLNQTYGHWELCLVNGDPRNKRVARLLDEYASQDNRVRVKHLDHNLGISGNSNAALEMATGDYIALLDHDDIIELDLLYNVVCAVNEVPATDIVYFDQDLVSANGRRYEYPLFKPAWSPELLLTSPYLTHAVIRRQLVAEVGGFDPAMDGTQDWDLFLRLAEHTSAAIHIPRVLYHWRQVPSSAAASLDAKPYVYARQLVAVEKHMRRRGLTDATAEFGSFGAIRVTWPPRGSLVSIIIAIHDDAQLLWRCLLSIRGLTAYQNYEIILVDTGTQIEAISDLLSTCKTDPRIRVVHCDTLASRWKAHNTGAAYARGDLFLFLDDRLEVLHSDWLEELVRWAELPDIGAVGAKVLYPDGQIQHAGLVVGLGGPAGHIFARSNEHTWGLLGCVEWYRNYSAVSGTCQIVRRDVFELVGGYDESYHEAYADVEMCLQIGHAGRRVMYTPWARLAYQARTTPDQPAPDEDLQRAYHHVADTMEHGDPYFNMNLSYSDEIPSLALAVSSSQCSQHGDPGNRDLIRTR